jgi:decaprenylphospho-beta-D-erythro-pentofuranosid-2-ulose 2-reductase
VNDATGMPQSAVVIGGTSEIAAAVLRALAAGRLQRVMLAGRDERALAAAAQALRELGVAEVHTAMLDVTDIARIPEVVAEIATTVGSIDLVLMAAGVLGDQAADEHDPVATARVLSTNLTGPAAVMTAFAGVLRRQGHGHIVVLSSVAGVRVRRANYIYGASKAGLDGFAQGLAEALRGSGASVMIVRPGWVATRMTAGRAKAPFATTPEEVAHDVIDGLARAAPVVWSPRQLRAVFALMRLLPAALWRRLPG